MPDVTYTGSALTPGVTLVLGSKKLVQDTDYTLAYSDNTAVGTAKVTATGKGNYTGTKTGSFTITTTALTDLASAAIEIEDVVFTGSAQEPSATVKVGTTTLTPGVDYEIVYTDNVKAGTATVTITGKGAYTGTKTATFKIEAKSQSQTSVASAKITVAGATYTGKALKPAVTVTLNGTTLRAGTDYTVSYADNTNVGTGKVTIQGIGSYTGSASASFTIAPKGTKLKKLKAGKRMLTIKWKKQTKQMSGYQLLLATNKKFTKGKKTLNIKGAKKATKKAKKLKAKKKYWVKIRTYKTVGGKRIYSAWSKVKTAKTK